MQNCKSIIHYNYFLFASKNNNYFLWFIMFLGKSFMVSLLLKVVLLNFYYAYASTDPSGFILFPLVIHSFDLVVSSIGILSIRGTRESGIKNPIEDPMSILQKGYSVTIFFAVIAFIAVSLSFVFSRI